MDIREDQVREIVSSIVGELAKKEGNATGPVVDSSCGFRKEKDPSGIIKISTHTVKCEPFQQKGVALKDVLTLEEAPRMGCGIMELENTSFEWTLTYDEYDMVIEGRLEIEIDGRVVAAGPNDIIYIPKGSHIHFQTRTSCRYAYFVYPANWSEL